MTGDLDGIRQQVMLRLGFFKGEWFLDEETGLPWYEEILVKNPNMIRVRDIFRTAICRSLAFAPSRISMCSLPGREP